MAVLIDQEAKRRIKSPIDLDNMSERYATDNELYTFTSPSLWVYEKNRYFLMKESVRKSFDPKYIMRPDFLSYDEYGTVMLAQLLMYINGVFSIEEFELSNVIIPKYSAVVTVLEDKFKKTVGLDKIQKVEW